MVRFWTARLIWRAEPPNLPCKETEISFFRLVAQAKVSVCTCQIPQHLPLRRSRIG
jgi:hypothetical protein